MKPYNPHRKTADILDRAWTLVQSVPYQVSARWLFYRLLQEGYYRKKSDYSKFLKAISTARKAFYGGWQPDTLADETREAIYRGGGYGSVNHWLASLPKDYPCVLDKWQAQPAYVELWFEARAMIDQFRHYTRFITLRPMGGQPSIPFKWESAKHLEQVGAAYDVPITILYFGDLDEAGAHIADVVETDVRQWCEADFEFIHCGLTVEQVRRYDVPENPEKPDEYQWEALPDEAAREIISGYVNRFLRQEVFLAVNQQETAATAWLANEAGELTKKWLEERAA